MFNQQLRVTKFLMLETGTYNIQYRRPYNLEMSGSNLNALLERCDGATSIQSTMFGGIANQILKPAATPETDITIQNGWDIRRLQFMMEVEILSNLGGKSREIILGYTSHQGVTASQAIDPQMEFYVNSVIRVRDTVAEAAFGQTTYSSVFENSHVLCDNNWNGILTRDKEHRMRPEDVFATMTVAGLNGIAGRIYDGRAISTTTVAKSDRNNNNASSYMANILDGYSRTVLDTSSLGATQEQLYSKARGAVASAPANKDLFLSAIAGVRGTGIGNTFTFKNLLDLDPGIEHVTHARLMDPVAMSTAHASGQTANWGGSDFVTSTAAILSNSIPSLMMDLAITKIQFKATNKNIDGSVTIQFGDVESFSSGDMSRQLDIFKMRLQHEILNDISYGNQVDYAVAMNVDLIGETWISVSINGEPLTDFVTPSFCDALMVPVVTFNGELASSIARDFEVMATSVIGDRPMSTDSDFAGLSFSNSLASGI